MLIGRSVSTIGKWESGERLPSLRVIGAIAAVLAVPVDALFADTEEVAR